MTDWMGGYTSQWEVREVDVDTWGDLGQVSGMRSISVSRDASDQLLETASIEFDGDGFEWAWLRVYVIADQNGREKHAITTQLFERSSSSLEKGARTIKVDGRSVLQPAADRKMERGGFAAQGSDAAAYIGRLLRECTPAPVTVEGSFTLSDDVVFDLGSTYLDAIYLLLDAANWCIKIGGDGTITVRPKPTEPQLELTMASAGLLMPGVSDDWSIIDIPNRYYAVTDDETAIAEVEDETSPIHRANRGRWVDMVDESPTLVDGEPLEAYARRRLREEATVTRSYSYTREWWPEVFPNDLVRATLARNGLDGELRVSKQQISCSKGITVEETAGLEVVPWQA